jgi:hypothetical protein
MEQANGRYDRLGHTLRGGTRSGVAGTYNRSELMDERKEALERWATHVAGIVAPLPENVVSLPRKRRRK